MYITKDKATCNMEVPDSYYVTSELETKINELYPFFTLVLDEDESEILDVAEDREARQHYEESLSDVNADDTDAMLIDLAFRLSALEIISGNI